MVGRSATSLGEGRGRAPRVRTLPAYRCTSTRSAGVVGAENMDVFEQVLFRVRVRLDRRRMFADVAQRGEGVRTTLQRGFTTMHVPGDENHHQYDGNTGGGGDEQHHRVTFIGKALSVIATPCNVCVNPESPPRQAMP